MNRKNIFNKKLTYSEYMEGCIVINEINVDIEKAKIIAYTSFIKEIDEMDRFSQIDIPVIFPINKQNILKSSLGKPLKPNKFRKLFSHA